MRRLRPIPTERRRGPACDIEGVDPSGAPISVEVVGATAPVLLLFLSADCIGCRDLWEGLSEFETGLAGACRVAVVTRGPGDEDVSAVARLARFAVRSEGEPAHAADNPAHDAESRAPTSVSLPGDRAGDGVSVVMSTRAYADYRVGGAPFYAVVGPAAVLGEGVAWGVDATLRAVRAALVASG